MVFTDYWKAYQAIIPNEQHRPVGKETRETVHVERWDNTLRQHLARFVRKTLSFSKCIITHEICLNLLLHRYKGTLQNCLYVVLTEGKLAPVLKMNSYCG